MSNIPLGVLGDPMRRGDAGEVYTSPALLVGSAFSAPQDTGDQNTDDRDTEDQDTGDLAPGIDEDALDDDDLDTDQVTTQD